MIMLMLLNLTFHASESLYWTRRHLWLLPELPGGVCVYSAATPKCDCQPFAGIGTSCEVRARYHVYPRR